MLSTNPFVHGAIVPHSAQDVNGPCHSPCHSPCCHAIRSFMVPLYRTLHRMSTVRVTVHVVMPSVRPQCHSTALCPGCQQYIHCAMSQRHPFVHSAMVPHSAQDVNGPFVHCAIVLCSTQDVNHP